MKKQQFNRTLLGVLFIAMTGLWAQSIFADASGGHTGSSRSQGSRDHEGSDGEQNHDNDLQGGEWSSDYKRRSTGVNIDNVRAGEPNDPEYSRSKEMLRERQ